MPADLDTMADWLEEVNLHLKFKKGDLREWLSYYTIEYKLESYMVKKCKMFKLALEKIKEHGRFLLIDN